LEKELFDLNYNVFSLDGDDVRKGLCNDLDFTEEGRSENMRRVAETCNLLLDSGQIVLAAFVSPLHADRERVKKIVGKEHYVEIFVDTPLSICEGRDVKGLYQKARKGVLPNFTGISSQYQVPINPDLIITPMDSLEQSVKVLLSVVLPRISV